MNTQQLELYQRIQQFCLDRIDAKLSFSKRLARDNNWTIEYAQRVIDEYKKFAFLAIVAGHLVTPSEQVDQVWHLHLIYTQSYWEDFCSQTLQKPLHHNPTKGGQQERSKFNDWYGKTLESYEHFFQQLPPPDIWSPPHIRFGRDIHFVRINTQHNWIIPKPDFSFLIEFRFTQAAVWMLSLLVSLSIITSDVPALASFPNPINRSLSEFFNFYLLVGCIGLLFIGILGLLLQRFKNDSRTALVLFAILTFVLFSLGTINLATGILNLPAKDFIGFYILSAIASFLFDFAILGWKQTKPLTRPSGMRGLDNTPSWEEFLQGNKVFLQESIATWLTMLSIFCLYSLGIARIIIGLSRHKPISYLVVLCLCVGVYLLWLLSRENDNSNSLIKTLIYVTVLLSGIVLLFLGLRILIWLIFALIFFVGRFSSTGGGYTGGGGSNLGGDGGDGCDGGGDGGGCGGCGGCGD
ncbi:glycine-rich domain-containing protein [Fischerella sp. PCC 9605]|uniref:glycine-rich domain-containing protein n=1 Tax=Fischerella sp. PCC 9605 TaxID=1173024 RepID=UPI00047B410E|nr:hypothetical protein [Fischerella sp. PCC 9605]